MDRNVTCLMLSVPYLPSSLNVWTRAPWMVRNRDRMEWAERMALHCLLAGLRSDIPVFSEPVRLTLTYRVGKKLRRQKFDVDNLVPKHLIDGLIGYAFPDDGPDYVSELVQRVVHDQPEDRTDILVEPLYPQSHPETGSEARP